MPNRNYLAGRRFEYATMRQYEAEGFTCLRTAGSHGSYDIIAYRPDQRPIFVQCKCVATESEAKRLVKTFGKETQPSTYFTQTIRVKVKRIGEFEGTING